MIKDRFFDRKNYLETLNKRVNGLLEGYRQNIAITGDELVGKTSLIYKFLDRFYDNRIISVYLEVRPEGAHNFTQRIIAVLLYNFLINSAEPLREDLDFLISRAERYIPQTAQKIRIILNNSAKNKAGGFSELISLFDLIYQETGKSCVVILDEFLNLESAGFKNLYRDWSKALITQKNTMYIVTSSLKFKARTVLSKNLSLLFGNFEVLNVEPFDIKTSEEFLALKLKDSCIDTATKNFLVHFTGGYPFYMDVISESIIAGGKRNNLTDCLEALLFDSAGILHQRFSNYLKRFLDSNNNNDYISILYLAASGRNKIKDIAHILHKTKKELSLRINHLLEVDAITRNGDFLRISDRVFGFWLKFVYQEKARSLTFDAKNQKTKFRGQIEETIKEFHLSANKSMPERMLELLRLFEDEIMQVEKKKIRLNHFREIKSLEFNGRSIRYGLLGRSSESLWIMAFKPEPLNEEDIADFSKECKRYRHKMQRKIIVTLQEIDTNTKLRAMEEKVWTWDINSLNKMLDLYSKPWMVV